MCFIGELFAIAINQSLPPLHELLFLQYIEPWCDHRLIYLSLVDNSPLIGFLLLFDDKVFKIVVLDPLYGFNFVRINSEVRFDVLPREYDIV